MSWRLGLIYGASGAVIAAAVAAIRAGAGFSCFLILAGAASLFAGPVISGLASAKLSPGLRATLAGIGLAALPLQVLMGMLKSATHHRPLGAVTFAVFALCVVAFALAMSYRVVLAGESRSLRLLRTLLFVAAAGGPLLLLARIFASTELRRGVFDLSLALGSATLLVLLPWGSSALRVLRAVGPAVWMLIVVAGAIVGLCLGGESARAASATLSAPMAWFLL